jgi:hypothetical protein
MQVASMAASQKTTASVAPAMSATPRSIADGSFMQSSTGQIYQSLCYTVKKRLKIFPSPAGMSLTKVSLDGNN